MGAVTTTGLQDILTKELDDMKASGKWTAFQAQIAQYLSLDYKLKLAGLDDWNDESDKNPIAWAEMWIKNVQMGQYEDDGQVYYVIFDEENGDLLFDTVEGVSKHFKLNPPKGAIYWVSPNEPIDAENFEWSYEKGEIKGWYNK